MKYIDNIHRTKYTKP